MIDNLLTEAQKKEQELINDGWILIGEGSKRKAYRSACGNHVVKIPKDHIGIGENMKEAHTYRTGDRNLLARCIMTFGFLIIMEYVSPIDADACDLPTWCKEYDNQVGYNKNGKLVAYDYGC
jgi:hypothetical protein